MAFERYKASLAEQCSFLPPRKIAPLKLPFAVPGVTGAAAEESGGDPITLGDPTGAGEAQVLGVRVENASSDKMDSTLKSQPRTMSTRSFQSREGNPVHIANFVGRSASFEPEAPRKGRGGRRPRETHPSVPVEDPGDAFEDLRNALDERMNQLGNAGVVDRVANQLEQEGQQAVVELEAAVESMAESQLPSLMKRFPQEPQHMYKELALLLARVSFLSAYAEDNAEVFTALDSKG
jgi:hypothetical protein